MPKRLFYRQGPNDLTWRQVFGSVAALLLLAFVAYLSAIGKVNHGAYF